MLYTIAQRYGHITSDSTPPRLHAKANKCNALMNVFSYQPSKEGTSLHHIPLLASSKYHDTYLTIGPDIVLFLPSGVFVMHSQCFETSKYQIAFKWCSVCSIIRVVHICQLMNFFIVSDDGSSKCIWMPSDIFGTWMDDYICSVV